MVSEQERNESKRRQAQGIKVAKDKGVYKGRPLLYSPKCERSSETYHFIIVLVEMLEEGQAISKIAKEVNITRQTIYRIKNEKGLS
ncbi:helix-turn-helix domain-containing protein [Staphylococcus aureus]|uniref:helix-turn-helix domain-containing protein n=1 Tax=Staphylococcus aureus TaxID=1280 RepID=UPI000A9929C5